MHDIKISYEKEKVILFYNLGCFFSGQSAVAINCPAKKFEDFWVAYRTNKNVRLQYTYAQPNYYFMNSLVSDEPIERFREESDQFAANYLEQVDWNIMKHEIHGYSVKIFKPDTDYQFELRFLRSKQCWMLTEIIDQSL